MTAETTNATATDPSPEPGPSGATPRNWMESVPQDWAAFQELRSAINESRHVRETFRDWLAKHVDESDHLRHGIGLYAAGDPGRALPHLQSADGDLAKLLVGLIHLDSSRTHDAQEVLTGLESSSAVGARARLALAEVLFAHRDVAALEKMLGGTTGSDQTYLQGLIAEAQGDHPTAMELWQATLEADADHADATFRLAQLLELLGDEDDAIELYARFLTGELPAHVGALMNLGILHEDQENHRWAAMCFQLVAEADPMNRRARTYLADAEASLEQFYDESRERKADKQSAVLRIPVTDFELSVRARNCLQRMNIHSLGDLVCRTESELLSFKNFGETSLQEVKDILNMKGLRLGMSPTADLGTRRSADETVTLAPDGNVQDVKISDLDLSVRSRAALATLGITKVGDLLSTTETTLLSCKNFGQTSLDEIKSKLRGLNLTLAT